MNIENKSFSAMEQWATWREILSQPAIWREWAQKCDFAAHRAWIADQTFDEVWFCGAGTSAFIGDVLAAGFEGRRDSISFRSVPTTDLVADPATFLSGRNPLVVSFGRSGNSSETLGTLDALDALCPEAPRLNITCNAESILATRTSATSRAVILPEATHDSGFAMTSSFSTMMLTALALFDQDEDAQPKILRTAEAFDSAFDDMAAAISAAPNRLVVLGSGPMTFAAREAALKVMELSAGEIACLWDSVLGFRHGPKSFVRESTDVVVFTTQTLPIAKYETDLVHELRSQFPDAKVTTVGPGGDIDLAHPDGPLWASVNAVLFAQLASAIWSQQLDYDVDNPFEGQGTLTRVVSGVTLYKVVQ